jgi:hypothetical protein
MSLVVALALELSEVLSLSRLHLDTCLIAALVADRIAQRQHRIQVCRCPMHPWASRRAWTTNLLALSTTPLPIGQPAAT